MEDGAGSGTAQDGLRSRSTFRAGPGAHHPFVYIQFAILIPSFTWIARAFKTPFYFDTPWSQCHWVCYFHPAFLCPVLLGLFYRISFKGLKKLLIVLGKASYEIFLAQMAVIAVLGSLFRTNKSLTYILLAWTLSLGLGLVLHRLLGHLRRRRTATAAAPAGR